MARQYQLGRIYLNETGSRQYQVAQQYITEAASVTYTETGSGGSTIAGSAITQVNYLADVLANGLTATSSAIVQITPSIVASGILGFGTSLQQTDYTNTIEANGLMANGEGIVSEVFFDDTVASGVTVDGTAIHDTDTVSSGVLANGLSVCDANYNPTTSSGILLSGSALEDYFSPSSGGVVVDGSALISSNQTTTTDSSGLLANGTSVEFISTEVNVTAVGVIANGSVILQYVYVPQIVTSGTFGSGIANINVVYNNILAPSGVLSSATANVSHISSVSVSAAGLLVSGTLTLLVTYNYAIASNGVYVSGLSLVGQHYSFQSTGQSIILDTSNIYKIIGLHLGYVTSGQVEMSGTVSTVYGPSWTSSGGITLASNNINHINSYRTTGSGVIKMGATNAIQMGSYSFVSTTASIVVGGITKATIMVNCRNPRSPCNLIQKRLSQECPSVDFYYSIPQKGYPTTSRGKGAYLPAITKCHQTVTTDRRR